MHYIRQARTRRCILVHSILPWLAQFTTWRAAANSAAAVTDIFFSLFFSLPSLVDSFLFPLLLSPACSMLPTVRSWFVIYLCLRRDIAYSSRNSRSHSIRAALDIKDEELNGRSTLEQTNCIFFCIEKLREEENRSNIETSYGVHAAVINQATTDIRRRALRYFHGALINRRSVIDTRCW